MERELTSDELNRLEPVVVSIIGPANQGKTCVIRTLAEDPLFGQVGDRAGTTTQVLVKKFFFAGTEYLRLCDTPGFQMSEELLDALVDAREDDFDLPEIIAQAEQIGTASKHDARAWKQIEQSHVLLYVIDINERPSARFRSELKLLLRAGRPLLPVYNFLSKEEIQSAPNYLEEWKRLFKDAGLFLDSVYDSHARNLDHERKLLERVKVNISDPLQERALQKFILEKYAREEQRKVTSATALADLLLDAAAYRAEEANVAKKDAKAVGEKLRDEVLLWVRRHESETQQKILHAWGFTEDRVKRKHGATEGQQSDTGPDWDKKIKRWAVSTAAGAAVGTAVGAAVDLVAAGVLIGIPTFIGTAIGTAVAWSYAATLEFQYNEQEWKVQVGVHENVLNYLLARNLQFIRQVHGHGHGNEKEIPLIDEPPAVSSPELLKILREFRRQAPLGPLRNPLEKLSDSWLNRRQIACEQLVKILLPLV